MGLAVKVEWLIEGARVAARQDRITSLSIETTGVIARADAQGSHEYRQLSYEEIAGAPANPLPDLVRAVNQDLERILSGRDD